MHFNAWHYLLAINRGLNNLGPSAEELPLHASTHYFQSKFVNFDKNENTPKPN